MIIRELQVINFRNLQFVRGEFSAGLNLIWGGNAQGKTNLLEAINLLVTGRSFRAAADRDLVPWEPVDYEATLIRARVQRQDAEERLIFTFNRTARQVLVNGVVLPRMGDLLGRINAVLFTPSDLSLVSGPPGGRRRFMDIAMSQVSQPYLHHLQRYDAVLRQANALLKSRRPVTTLRDEISVRHSQLAHHGAALYCLRRDFIERVSAKAAASYSQTAGGIEAMALKYLPSPAALAFTNAPDPKQSIEQALDQGLDDALRRGFTAVGPHRDDFDFIIDGRDAREFGSQGQQRTCALALKTAELAVMEQEAGEPPVFLLDDLMSELDEGRKKSFLESLDPRIQTLITATEKTLVSSLAKCDRSFKMSGGKLTEA